MGRMEVCGVHAGRDRCGSDFPAADDPGPETEERIPGPDVPDLLQFSPRKAAALIRKVLLSAVANAEHNNGADIDSLVVSKIMVDEGPSLKRIMPRAKGRADRIVKRSSHITVVVADSVRG